MKVQIADYNTLYYALSAPPPPPPPHTPNKTHKKSLKYLVTTTKSEGANSR